MMRVKSFIDNLKIKRMDIVLKYVKSNLTEICLLAIIFFAPVFFAGSSGQGLAHEKTIIIYIFCILAAIIWLSRSMFSGKIVFKNTNYSKIILFVFLTFSATAIFSINLKDSFIGFYGQPVKNILFIAIMILLFYVLVNNLKADRIKYYLSAFLISGFLVQLLSILSVFNVNVLPWKFIQYGFFNPLGSISALSVFVSVALPLYCVFFVHPEIICSGKKSQAAARFFCALSSLMSIAILFIISNYVYWPAVMVGVATVLVFYIGKIIKVKNKWFLSLPLAVLVLSLACLVMNNLNLLKFNLPAEYSLSRSLSWQIAKDSFKENPVFGSGIGTFTYNFNKHKNQEFNLTALWNEKFEGATGIYPEIAATTGLLGLIASLALIIYQLMKLYKYSLAGSKEIDQVIFVAGLSSYVSFLVISALYYLTPGILVVLGVLYVFFASVTAIVEDSLKSIEFDIKEKPQSALFVSVGYLAVMILAAGLIIEISKNIYAEKTAIDAIYAQEDYKKVELLAKAAAAAPYEERYALVLANMYKDLTIQNNSASSTTKTAENYSNALYYINKALAISKNNPEILMAKGMILEASPEFIKENMEQAKDLYKQASELDPNNPLYFIRLSSAELAMSGQEQDNGKRQSLMESSLNYLDEAIKKKINFAEAYYGKYLVLQRMGKTNDSIAQLETAYQADPANQNYKYELSLAYIGRGLLETTKDSKGSKDGKIVFGQDLKNAEILLKDIIKQEPKHENAHFNLITIYYKTGQMDKAKADYKELMGLIKDDSAKKYLQEQFPLIK